MLATRGDSADKQTDLSLHLPHLSYGCFLFGEADVKMIFDPQ